MGIQKDKLTEAQKQEIERLRQFVARNRLNAQMNGTKWRAAIDAVTGIAGYQPSFRVKCIPGGAEPPENIWDEDFPGNVPLYNSIEWLELNVRPPASTGAFKKGKSPDFSEALKAGLTAVRVPFVETPSGIRIIGYSRN